MLARCYCLRQGSNSLFGRRRIEENEKVRSCERFIEVHRPIGNAVPVCDFRQTHGVTSDQQQTRHDTSGPGGQSAFG